MKGIWHDLKDAGLSTAHWSNEGNGLWSSEEIKHIHTVSQLRIWLIKIELANKFFQDFGYFLNEQLVLTDFIYIVREFV